MSSVAQNIEKLREEIPEGVNLVAVSKFHPASMIIEAYKTGQRKFGESRVQELLKKVDELPSDIEWHYIGHLQTNKVRMLIGKTALIESVDSEHLLDLIDKESERAGIVTKVLMQIHVAQEETKFGFYPNELLDYFRQHKYRNLCSTHICGIMGMASNTDDEMRIRQDFKEIASVYNQIREDFYDEIRGFDILSMGMSGDWKVAVEEGSNLIRVGSSIFGVREY